MGGRKKVIIFAGLGGLAIGVCAMLAVGGAMTRTSTNEYCMSCHYTSRLTRTGRSPSTTTARVVS